MTNRAGCRPDRSFRNRNVPALPRLRALRRGAIAALSLFVLALTPLFAQQGEPGEEKDEPIGFFGIFGGIGLNTHAVALDPLFLTGGPPAPVENLFVEGAGSGLTAGLLLELPLSGSFGFGARASLQNRGGEMDASYTNTTDVTTVGGTVRPANVRGDVESRLPYLAVTPHFRVMPQSLPLYFFAGPSLLVPIGATYDYTETIETPDLVFGGTNSASRSRALDRDIPDASTKLAVTLGLGAEFFLTDRIALIADAQYSPMIGSISSALEEGDAWRADMSSLTLGIKFGFGRRGGPPPPPPPPPPAEDDSTEVDTVETFRAGVLAGDELKDTLVARGQRVKQTDVYALLPYIFFDAGSAEIPGRYLRIDRRDVKSFREETVAGENAIELYYHLLNIIGYRMRRARRATLTITGCIGAFEEADSSLAEQRATAVRDYLRDTWRIREDKMEIVVRDLPRNPSDSDIDPKLGDVENQRVEFHASDLGILAPIRQPDTLLLQPTGIIRLLPPPSDLPDSIAATESWEVNVRIGDSLIQRAATGFGGIPEKIDVEIEDRPDLGRRGPIEITSELIILDSTYSQRKKVPSNPVWFVEEGGFLVDRNVEEGMYVDRYNLLLYSFDSADLFDFAFQAEDILREKIYPNSEVTVIGHTDRIGLPYYNKRLSLRRAETAAKLLQFEDADVRGSGEKDPLYDNETPEGRYYSRTVTVIIRTPIPEGAAVPVVEDPVELDPDPSDVEPTDEPAATDDDEEIIEEEEEEGIPRSSSLPDGGG